MLEDKLKRYAQSGIYPFHMPGHKRNFSGCLPYELDVTEIDGFDNLHEPEGCLREIERRAERLYDSKRAFLLVNGATAGILASVRAMTRCGDTVITARNCHRSVYNAIELCGLKPVYILPDAIYDHNFFGAVSPGRVAELLLDNPNARLVIITSPTYEGVCSDVKKISEICRSNGAKLLIDEAHGAHFPFGTDLPPTALECGADVSVVSLHKTLPAPTQTALLLTNDLSLEQPLQNQLSVFQTSSPSYLLMCGIEKCLDYIENNSFEEYTEMLDGFYRESLKLKKLSLLFNCYGASPVDKGKLVILTDKTAFTGRELADMLREEFKLETEMSGADYVIAMTSVCDTKDGFDRLLSALLEIDGRIEYSDKELKSIIPTTLPQKVFDPCDAVLLKPGDPALIRSDGVVSLDYINAYPPGIPFVVPGELISREMLEAFSSLSKLGVKISNYDRYSRILKSLP